MRFITTCHEISQALNVLKACVRRGFPQTPLLLASLQNQVCFLTADSEFLLSISLKLQDTSVEGGVCCVDFKQFLHACKSLPKLDVEVSFIGEERLLLTASDGTQVALTPLPHDVFPGIQEMHILPGGTYTERESSWKSGTAWWQDRQQVVTTSIYETLSVRQQGLSFQCSELLEPLRQTSLAVATDDARTVLTTIATELREDMLTFAAVDAKGLATVSLLQPGSGTWQTTLPLPTIFARVITSLPKLANAQLEASIATHHLVCRNGQNMNRGNRPFERIEVITLTSEALFLCVRPPYCTYPDFRSVIPTHMLTKVECQREPLEKAVKALMRAAKSDHYRLCFTCSAKMLTLTALYYEASGPNTEKPERKVLLVEASTEGPEVTIVLHAKRVLDFLDATTAKNIRMELTSSDSCVLFRPLESELYRYILMPMRKMDSKADRE